ncbi:MAG: hypothetical protein F6J87_15905 [Spirulina sp. SIO3F2]|nr:hypothetical protein [Spirulina sp. SIO3F2]
MMSTGFYTVGGTVQAGGGVYLPRQADEELLVLCREAIFAYVLTPRQMGKSSLMVNTAEHLRAEGIAPVIIDLQQLGTTVTAEQWYLGLLTTFEDQLELETDAIDWWERQPQLGFAQRLTLFFETVLLPEVAGQVVVFVDEIDTTLSLAFTDDFYAAIRFLYTVRAQNRALRRLSFVLVGVATPTDLIRDPKRTPFNIGQRVDLTDFTLEEAHPLTAGFGTTQGERVLQWVFDWTGGHPYLTQRLCAALVADGREVWTAVAVTEVVRATFLGEMSDRDSNLQFVRDMLVRRSATLGIGAVLEVYLAVLRGKGVSDEEQSLVKSHLKLSGVVVRQAERLALRNEIYRRVFDRAWVRRHLPVNWLKQVRRIAAGLGILFLIAPAPFAVFAWQQWQGAESARESAEVARDAEKEQRMLAEENQAEAENQQVLAEEQRTLALRAKAEADKQRKIAEGKRKDADASRTKAVTARIAEKEQRLVAERERRAAVAARGEEARQRRVAELKTAEAEVARLAEVEAWAEAEEQREIAREQGFIARANLAQIQYLDHQGLDALLTAVKLGKEVKYSSETTISTKFLATANLREIVYGIREKGRFQAEQLTGFSDVVFSPDGQILAAASHDGTVRLWQQNGKALATLKGHSGKVWGVSFSPDGQTVVSVGTDRTVKVWNLQGEELATLKSDTVKGIGFGPDGLTIASESRGGIVRLWNLQGDELAILEGHSGTVVGVSFSPDGQTIASVASLVLKLWTRDGEELATRQLRSSVVGISFSPDGQAIASMTSDGTVEIWRNWHMQDRSQGQQSRTPKITISTLNSYFSKFRGLSFSPDSRTIASASEDGTVKLWTRHSRTGGSIHINSRPAGSILIDEEVRPPVQWWTRYEEDLVTLEAHSDRVNGVSFSPDSQTIASASSDGTIKLWDRDGEKPVILKDYLDEISFSPDGQIIATGGSAVRLWNRDGEVLAILEGEIIHVFYNGSSMSENLTGISFSPDGKTIAMSGHETVKLWNRDREILTVLESHSRGVNTTRFSPDGQIIASGSYDGTMQLWTQDGEEIITLEGHSERINEVNFSPDSQIIASASDDRTVKLWTRDGEELTTIKGHDNRVLMVSFSPDGQTVASASEDKTVKLWTRYGKELATLKGHSGRINKVNFSPDGQIIASGSSDGTVRLWTQDGEEIITLEGHSNNVNGIHFSADSQTLTSVDRDGNVILWNLNLDDLLVRGCQKLNNYLTHNPKIKPEDRDLCKDILP